MLSTKASVTPPSEWLVLSYLGISFFIILVINLAFLLIWIISFRWKFILINLGALFLCQGAINTYIPFNSRDNIEVPETAIKLLSYNVRGFDWLTGKEARENPILEYIANSGADIVCLQEFAVEDKRDKKNKIISLKEFDDVMEDYPYRTIIRLGDTLSSCIYGLACYSKFPIMRVARVPLDSYFNGSAMYEIRAKGKMVTVVNNHLESNHITAEDKALYKELVVDRKQEKIPDVFENMKSKLNLAFRVREQQIEAIYGYINMQRKETPRMIVCGDFNDTPMSYAYGRFSGDFLDAYRETGRGMGITYHENGFLFRIDYILHTANIDSYLCTVDEVKYSDHYPIYAFLRL